MKTIPASEMRFHRGLAAATLDRGFEQRPVASANKYSPDQPRDDHGRWVSEGEASDLADEMHGRAVGVEPKITSAMSAIAGQSGGTINATIHFPDGHELHTLDARLKSEDSTQRKIIDDMRDKGLTAEQAASQITDAVRYTIVLPDAKYADGAEAAMEAMKAQGYEPLRGRDFWTKADGYAGINTVWRDPASGLPFEMQFHTQETLDFKETVSHPLYEEARVLPDGEQKAAIESHIVSAWQTVRADAPYLDHIAEFMQGLFTG